MVTFWWRSNFSRGAAGEKTTVVWVAQNINPVLKTINNLNSKNVVKSINSFDSSTLCTKLSLEKLLTVFHKLIDFCFDGGEKNSFWCITLGHVEKKNKR